jgi:hypothetical protein
MRIQKTYQVLTQYGCKPTFKEHFTFLKNIFPDSNILFCFED